jgi:hypothetical protein
MSVLGTVSVSGNVAVRSAPVALRLLGGALDLCLYVGLFLAYLVFVEHRTFGDLPPRYWNYFDYLVDLTIKMDLKSFALKGVLGYAGYEIIFGLIMRNTPFSRLLGMRFVRVDGKRPLLFRLLLKTVFQIVFFMTGLFGVLFSFVHPEKRMLQDCLSGCYCLMEDVRTTSLADDADLQRS